MKDWTPMKVTVVGQVTEVVMGGRKHSGRGSYGSRGSRSRSSSKGPRGPRFL